MIDLRQLIFFVVALNCMLAAPYNGTNNDNCHKKLKKYRVSIDTANFYQAFINCKNGGMELASAESEEESNALDAYLDPFKQEGWENAFWLSGTNINNLNSKQYYWLSTGNRAIFTKWILAEPDNAGGVQHNMIWAQFTNIIGWGDENPSVVLRYVCQYYVDL